MCSSLLSSPDIWDALDELWVSEDLGSDSHGSLAGELVDNNLVFGLHFVVLFANWVDLLNEFGEKWTTDLPWARDQENRLQVELQRRDAE